MLEGIAIVVAFSAGMWVMKVITIDYEDRIINAVKGREYARRRQESQRPAQPQHAQAQRQATRPMISQEEYERLMREGRIAKRR